MSPTIRVMDREAPWLVALGLMLGLLAVVCASMLAGMNRVEYALDDPYIHMAIAKHLVEHGVWGVTRYEFSASSSSLLWTLLLAGLSLVKIDGRMVPLALNVFSGAAVLYGFDVILRRRLVSPMTRTATLLCVVLVTPLVPVIATGMEHTLQILLFVGFLYLAACALAGNAGAGLDRWLLVLAPVLTGIRYEGMFPLALVCGAFVLKRRWLYAVALGAVGLAPIVAFGLYSMSHGWYFFPNTILIKAKPPTEPLALLKYLVGFLGNGRYVGFPAIVRFPYILSLFVALVLVVAVLWRRGRRLGDDIQVFALLMLGALVLHMQFARINWFYRYEAYVYAGTILAVVLAFHERFGAWLTPGKAWRTWVRPGAALLLIAAPLGHGLKGLPNIPRSSRCIYEYEVQVARFLDRYYPGESVVLGEIGAPNYFADVRAFDYEGLGSIESAHVLIRSGRLKPEDLARMARERNAKIAFGHVDVWNEMGSLPEEWVFVGEWDAHDTWRKDWTERFYAIDPAEADRLRRSLKEFSSQHLPWVTTRLAP